jgi:hypothetical protein
VEVPRDLKTWALTEQVKALKEIETNKEAVEEIKSDLDLDKIGTDEVRVKSKGETFGNDKILTSLRVRPSFALS